MSDALTVTDPHNVTPTFVNDVVGSGFLNGVCNITFATALFTPSPEGTIIPDLIISSRLRMDLFCAIALRDALNHLIEANAKGAKAN
jgi:hypothetical protein